MDLRDRKLATSSQQGPKVWVEWHQRQGAQFDYAEFYALGPVVSVHYSDEANKIWDEIIEIRSEGNRDWQQDDEERGITWNIYDPEEFRKQFPDGHLPKNYEDGWTIIEEGCFVVSSPSVLVTETIFYSLTNAIGYAKHTLQTYGAAAHS